MMRQISSRIEHVCSARRRQFSLRFVRAALWKLLANHRGACSWLHRPFLRACRAYPCRARLAMHRTWRHEMVPVGVMDVMRKRPPVQCQGPRTRLSIFKCGATRADDRPPFFFLVRLPDHFSRMKTESRSDEWKKYYDAVYWHKTKRRSSLQLGLDSFPFTFFATAMKGRCDDTILSEAPKETWVKRMKISWVVFRYLAPCQSETENRFSKRKQTRILPKKECVSLHLLDLSCLHFSFLLLEGPCNNAITSNTPRNSSANIFYPVLIILTQLILQKRRVQ